LNEQELRERVGVAVEQSIAPRLKTLIAASAIEVRLAGQLLYQGAFGTLGDGETGARVTLATQFDLDALTELFTMTTFLRLVDMGRLWIDTPLKVVLPDAAADVTFYHLLTHTSGLPRTIDLCGLRDYESRIMAIEFAKRVMPTGEFVVHSPLDFMLLGLAIQTLTDLPLEQAIALYTLQPLDLRAGFAPLPRGLSVAATSPKTHGTPYDANTRCLGDIAGHAGMFGSATDVTTLANVYLDGGRFKSTHFLSRAVAEEATRPHQHHIGFGWQLNGVHWMHNAKTGVAVRVDPLRQLTFVLLTNTVWDGKPQVERQLDEAGQELFTAIRRLVDDAS
jgi:CubicO group peptidase (beta-lactamase class C family)